MPNTPQYGWRFDPSRKGWYPVPLNSPGGPVYQSPQGQYANNRILPPSNAKDVYNRTDQRRHGVVANQKHPQSSGNKGQSGAGAATTQPGNSTEYKTPPGQQVTPGSTPANPAANPYFNPMYNNPRYQQMMVDAEQLKLDTARQQAAINLQGSQIDLAAKQSKLPVMQMDNMLQMHKGPDLANNIEAWAAARAALHGYTPDMHQQALAGRGPMAGDAAAYADLLEHNPAAFYATMQRQVMANNRANGSMAAAAGQWQALHPSYNMYHGKDSAGGSFTMPMSSLPQDQVQNPFLGENSPFNSLPSWQREAAANAYMEIAARRAAANRGGSALKDYNNTLRQANEYRNDQQVGRSMTAGARFQPQKRTVIPGTRVVPQQEDY